MVYFDFEGGIRHFMKIHPFPDNEISYGVNLAKVIKKNSYLLKVPPKVLRSFRRSFKTFVWSSQVPENRLKKQN